MRFQIGIVKDNERYGQHEDILSDVYVLPVVPHPGQIIDIEHDAAYQVIVASPLAQVPEWEDGTVQQQADYYLIVVQVKDHIRELAINNSMRHFQPFWSPEALSFLDSSKVAGSHHEAAKQ